MENGIANEVTIIEYNRAYASELLELLLKLHTTYFFESSSRQLQELKEERDVKNSYENYLELIHACKDDTWKVYLAITPTNKVPGFIIGSIIKDQDLVRSTTGKLEDWFVEKEYRAMGIGEKLYHELEKWFVKKGCDQLWSDTWSGNEISIRAHQHLDFFISGISFSKKLK